MKEVNCLGTEKFELGDKVTRRYVKIFNEKIQVWQEYLVLEFESKCPVCKSNILVRALEWSYYLACCSEECYKKYHEAKEQGKLGELCKWG